MPIGPTLSSITRPFTVPSEVKPVAPVPETAVDQPQPSAKQAEARTVEDAKDIAAHPEGASIYDQTRMRAQALQLYFALIHHPGPAQPVDPTRLKAADASLAMAVADAVGAEDAPLDLAEHLTALREAAETLRQLDLEIARENADKLASYFAAKGIDKSPPWRLADAGQDDEVFWAKFEARPARILAAG